MMPKDLSGPSIPDNVKGKGKATRKQKSADPGPPLPQFSWNTYYSNARIRYYTDVNSANAFLSEWCPTVVGFDIEWKPNFVKGEEENPVALLQLATKENILLLHLSRMNVHLRTPSMPHFRQSIGIPYRLKSLLSDPQVIKLGVGIKQDGKKLFDDFSIDVCGLIDLSVLTKEIDPQWAHLSKRESIGLQRLCKAYLGMELKKGKIARSNWEKLLTDEQQTYAANDALVALAVYDKLLDLKQVLTDMPAVLFDVIRGIATPTEVMALPGEHEIVKAPEPPVTETIAEGEGVEGETEESGQPEDSAESITE